jgi:hypothetical protein
MTLYRHDSTAACQRASMQVGRLTGMKAKELTISRKTGMVTVALVTSLPSLRREGLHLKTGA